MFILSCSPIFPFHPPATPHLHSTLRPLHIFYTTSLLGTPTPSQDSGCYVVPAWLSSQGQEVPLLYAYIHEIPPTPRLCVCIHCFHGNKALYMHCVRTKTLGWAGLEGWGKGAAHGKGKLEGAGKGLERGWEDIIEGQEKLREPRESRRGLGGAGTMGWRRLERLKKGFQGLLKNEKVWKDVKRTEGLG